MVVVIVVLVGIPYIILHNSLTADEQEDKYEEAHRWEGARKRLKEFNPRFIGLGFVAVGFQNIFPFIKSYPLRWESMFSFFKMLLHLLYW